MNDLAVTVTLPRVQQAYGCTVDRIYGREVGTDAFSSRAPATGRASQGGFWVLLWEKSFFSEFLQKKRHQGAIRPLFPTAPDCWRDASKVLCVTPRRCCAAGSILQQWRALWARNGLPVGGLHRTPGAQPVTAASAACARRRSSRASSLRLPAVHGHGESEWLQRCLRWPFARPCVAMVQEKHAARRAMILSSYGG